MKIFPITTLIDKLEDYLKVKGEKLKLEIMGHTAKVLSYAITFILLGVIGLFFFLFIYLSLAVYLNHLLDSIYLGYLIISGFILLQIVIIMLLLKTGKIQKWLESMILNLGDDE